MLKSRNILLKVAAKAGVILVMVAITQFVFAVSGIKSNGGDDKSRNAHSSCFSNIKSSVTFSLKNDVHFNSAVVIPNTQENFVMYNTIVTYKKGSVTYVLPYKTRSIKLPGFISMGPLPCNK
ncbi:MAG: hypothetical protein C5B52_07005 [Bacteroidetes bacterium]|nr:MAG: hypothetical protein C5B52_07005 [Bacteroidota bacterium]